MKNHYKIKCFGCGKEVWRENKQQYKVIKNTFCSYECSYKNKITSEKTNCGWCNKEVVRVPFEKKKSKSGLSFCNHSCSASYNNTKKRKSRRSKCEAMLFDLLKNKYNTLEMFPNYKEMLDGLEVDIGIPSLNMAIEWNGIVHFKPIYGDDKLTKIQNLDLKKQLIANEKNIRLIVISDLVSSEKYVIESFHYICNIIDKLYGI